MLPWSWIQCADAETVQCICCSYATEASYLTIRHTECLWYEWHEILLWHSCIVHKKGGFACQWLGNVNMHIMYAKCDQNTVSHLSYAPLFQGPHFLTKELEWNILYDNTYWHFICLMLSKECRNHSCEPFCYVKGNFDKNARASWTSIFAVCARHYPWWSLWQKNTKNYYFVHVSKKDSNDKESIQSIFK